MKEKLDPIFKKYGQIIITNLISKYDELGLRASGDFEKEIELIIEGTTLTVMGAYHSQFMEKGRRAGGRPPIASIMRWLDFKKGLPASMYRNKRATAFAIANKIASKGIQVPNKYNKGEVIKSVIDSFLLNDVTNMINEIGQVFFIQTRSDVVSILKRVA